MSVAIRLKPYLLVTGDFVKTGGMDRANHALAEYLADRGHEVHLVAHRASDDLLRRPNVIFHRVAQPARSYLLGAPLLDRAGRKVGGEIDARGGRVLVNGGNCCWGDVNWVHYVHAAYDPSASAGPLRRAKNALARRLFLSQERKALPRASTVIVNSERTKLDVVGRLGVEPSRVHTVYLGVDPDLFRPADARQRTALRRRLGWDEARPVAVFIGALGDRRKGFDTTFDAWRRLSIDRAWDVDLAVIGSGPELPLWRRRAADAGLDGRLKFLGFRPDVHEVLRACDLLVAPTRYEAYGLGVHEALCCGVPALVSVGAGIAERYPGDLRRQTLLDDPNDAAGLASKLRAWRKDVETYRASVDPISRTLRAHTWRAMAEQMLQVIEAVD